MNRKKGLIIITNNDGKKNIPLVNCSIYELIVDETNGVQVIYKPIPNVNEVAQKAFETNSLVNIIHT